jgi:hypothetical protein
MRRAGGSPAENSCVADACVVRVVKGAQSTRLHDKAIGPLDGGLNRNASAATPTLRLIRASIA